jgi:hypothetical protein
MKIGLLVMLYGFAALSIHSQPGPAGGAKDVIVLENKWRFEVSNPLMDQDPLREAKLQEERGLAQARSVNSTNQQVTATLKEPVYGKTIRGNLSGRYLYEIKVKNVGKRQISGLVMAYVFTDAQTKQELDRVTLSTSSKIGAGKTRTLRFRTIAPPTGAVDARNEGKKTGDLYIESVVIQSVRYAKDQ